MLTESELAQFLLRKQLISRESITKGDLVVEDVSRRNYDFKIISKRGRSYFVKHAAGAERVSTVEHEARLYNMFCSEVKRNHFGRHVPRYYEYDPKKRVLIIELIRDGENLREYHIRRRCFSSEVASALGNIVGSLHGWAGTNLKKLARIKAFVQKPPWALSLHHPGLRLLREMSSANIQIIKIVQQFEEFSQLLDNLRSEWKADTLIHFDLRWDNCIVLPQSIDGSNVRLKIVDWELAGLGDPCWDIASIFADYLSFWLLSIPITGETPPDQFVELARFPLERIQPALRSFWRSYDDCMELDAATSNEWLLRTTKYAAARLIQTAFEQTQFATQLTGNIVCLMQVSLNILRRPQEAIVHLLGVPLVRTG